MRIVLPALGVAVAAFCVWLTVRIVNRRERWAKWTAILTLPMLYVLSAGPTGWLIEHKITPPWFETASRWFYTPLFLLYVISPDPIKDALEWYEHLWR
jgi:cytochrome bd-type quinol oxidase subunit 2